METQETSKKALVLSGGSILGAFQAGAISHLLKQGFQPDIIMGISAGALNSTFLVNEAGKMGDNLDWEIAGKELKQFWLKEVTQPKDLVRKPGLLTQLWRLLTNKFNGLMDYSPLVKMLNKQINSSYLRNSPAELVVGAVDWSEGDMEYRNQQTAQILDYVIASASIPVFLPHWKINDRPFIDGGIRDVVPLNKLIDRGIEEVVVIATQPSKMKEVSPQKVGNLGTFILRFIDIMLNEILSNDLATLEKVNQELVLLEKKKLQPIGSLKDKRFIKSTVIRPAKSYDITLQDFHQKDIRRLISDGEQAARIYPAA